MSILEYFKKNKETDESQIISSNGDMSQKKKIRIDIISLILVIICVFGFGLVGSGISVIFLAIYAKTSKKHSIVSKILLILCFIGISISFFALYKFNAMESQGLDSLGEALVYSLIMKFGYSLTIEGSILSLTFDNIEAKTTKIILISIEIIFYVLICVTSITSLIQF